MKHLIISKFQGIIIALPVLIAATLVMTIPSTVLGAGKAQYVVTLQLTCQNDYEADDTQSYATINFYSSKAVLLGSTEINCHATGIYGTGGGWNSQTVTTDPMQKPAYFEGMIVLKDPAFPDAYVSGYCGSWFRHALPALWAGQTNEYLNCVWPSDYTQYPKLHHVELTVYDPTTF